MTQLNSFFRKNDVEYNIVDVEENNIVIADSDDDATIDIESESEVENDSVDLIRNTYPRPKKYVGINMGLRSPEEIPLLYRNIFKYPTFNEIQTKVMDDVLYSDKQIVVSSPTGSGKTVIFELAIIQLLLKIEDVGYSNNFKIIYLAPIKALCSERYVDWTKKFKPVGLNCCEVTGDSDIMDLREIEQYKILLTTPEKWDSLTRRWRDNEDFVKTIKLFLIDEVHLVNEDRRGPILEAVVSRMKTIHTTLIRTKEKNIFCYLRFIAVSATIPNIEDLACWFGGTNDTIYHKMSEDSRPIILQKYVLGFKGDRFASSFRFDMSLNYRLSNVIQKYSTGKPTMVFCSTRKGVEMAASVLNTDLSMAFNDNQKKILQNLSLRFQDSKLKDFIKKGVTYHHAGLIPEDRSIIEEMFRDGMIPVLLCTSTLAMGINLPAHLVIIKSTQTYNQGSVSEYSESAILQMIGRAGRPQFDTSGTAVIMTQNENVLKYEKLVNGTAPVESHLHKYLAEHLNAEIVLKTITDLAVAMEWLRSTFLYVRAIKNPAYYGLMPGLSKEKIEKKLQEMCLIEINSLEKHGLIIKDKNDGLSIVSTVYGKLMSRYYLNFNTMKLFRQIKGNETLTELLNILSRCHEFSEYTLRVSDKRILNELNKSNDKEIIRYPIQGKIKCISDKVFCLMQATLGCLPISDSSLSQEATKIVRLAVKISKSLAECIRISDKNLGDSTFQAILNSILLSKCFQVKLWENSRYVSRQLKKIGPALSTLLANDGKTSFKALLDSNPRELERIVNKTPPFGNELIESVKKLPKYDIQIYVQHPKLGKVTVQQMNNDYKSDHRINSQVSLIIGDTFNNLLLFHENIEIILNEKIFEKMFRIKNSESPYLLGYVIHHSLVGVDEFTQITTGVSLSPVDIQCKTQNTKTNLLSNKKTITLKKDDSSKKMTDYFTSKSKVKYTPNIVNVQNENKKKFGVITYNNSNPIAAVKSNVTSYQSNLNFKRKLDNYKPPEKLKISKEPNYQVIEILEDERVVMKTSEISSKKNTISVRQQKFNDVEIENNSVQGRFDLSDFCIPELIDNSTNDNSTNTTSRIILPKSINLSKVSSEIKKNSKKCHENSLILICDPNCFIVKKNSNSNYDKVLIDSDVSDNDDEDCIKEINGDNIGRNQIKNDFMLNEKFDDNLLQEQILEELPKQRILIHSDIKISSPKISLPVSKLESSKSDNFNVFPRSSFSHNSTSSSSFLLQQKSKTDKIGEIFHKIKMESNNKFPQPLNYCNNNISLKRPRNMTVHIKRDNTDEKIKDEQIKRHKYLDYCKKNYEESKRNGLNLYKDEDYRKDFVYFNVADLPSCESNNHHIVENTNNNRSVNDEDLDELFNFDSDSPSFEVLFSQNMNCQRDKHINFNNSNTFF